MFDQGQERRLVVEYVVEDALPLSTAGSHVFNNNPNPDKKLVQEIPV